MDLLIHIKHNLLISNNLDQIWFWKKIPITFSQGCTNSRKRPTWHPSARTDFIGLGSVTINRKNGLTWEQLAVGTDSWFVSTGPSRMFSILTEGCHVGYSLEFVGTVYCTYRYSRIRPMMTVYRLAILRPVSYVITSRGRCWKKLNYDFKKLCNYELRSNYVFGSKQTHICIWFKNMCNHNVIMCLASRVISTKWRSSQDI